MKTEKELETRLQKNRQKIGKVKIIKKRNEKDEFDDNYCKYKNVLMVWGWK